MTTVYKFKTFYTRGGVGAAPSAAPTVTIVDTDNTVLVNAQAATALSNLTGAYIYEYSGADALDLLGKFATTDETMDAQELGCVAEYTPVDVWSYATRTLSAFGFSVTVATNNDKTGYSLSVTPPTASDVAAAVWSYVTRTITSGTITVAEIWDALLTGITTAGSVGKLIKDYLDAAITSRLASASYTAPDNASITAIKTKTDGLPADPADQSAVEAAITAAASSLATAANLAIVDGVVDAIKAKTDNLPADPASMSDIATAEVNILSAMPPAPDNVSITAIKAKTDGLPIDPADQSAVEAAITAAASSLATAANLAIVDGAVDAIKAKTDNLPATPADQSLIAAAIDALPTAAEIDTQLSNTHGAGSWLSGGSGSGSISHTVNITVDSAPRDGVAVWCTTDEAGVNVVASGVTDAFGNVVFLLDPGTYWVWKQLANVNFTNPQSMVVS